MVFSSPTFLYLFLPLFLLAYFAGRTVFARNIVFVAFSLVFYAWGEPRFIFVLLVSILVNFRIGKEIDRHDGRRRTFALTAGLVWNLGILGIVKYAGFAAGLANELLQANLSFRGWSLPLGVSFFTFHAVSYLLDVYRRNAPAEQSLLRLTLYITMFPQLVAGPIIRYKTIARELGARRTTLWRASTGLRIFAIGMTQKVLIANQLGVVPDAAFNLGQALDPAEAWIGLVGYSLQIYFDFAGYSNMAIGLAMIVGFAFPRNFDLPYTSRSITEFWRRWHISLSRWFRDYLYIPLGGNRKGEWRTYANLAIVFLLCGLWHGASLNFVIWGAWYGAFLIVERAGLLSILARLPWPVANAYAVLVVMLGWVFFRAETLPDSLVYLETLVGRPGDGLWNADLALTYTPYRAGIAVVAIVLATVPRGIGAVFRGTAPQTLAGRVSPAFPAARLLSNSVWLGLFALCMLDIAGAGYNPFLYFRF